MLVTTGRRDAFSHIENSSEPKSAFAFAREAPCRVGLPQEGTPSFREAGNKNAALGAGYLTLFRPQAPSHARPIE